MTADLSLEGRTVELGGAPFHYVDVGEGAPEVLIHGGGPGASGVSNFRRNIGPLSAGRRVIVVDLPGYGGSASRPVPGGLFKSLSGAVLQLLDTLGIETASFVGNSLGGGTALRTALDRPERVSKLVVMGAGGGLPVFSPFPTEGLQRMLTFYGGEGPSMERLRRVIELLVYDSRTITPDLLEERYAAATRPEVLASPPLNARAAAA